MCMSGQSVLVTSVQGCLGRSSSSTILETTAVHVCHLCCVFIETYNSLVFVLGSLIQLLVVLKHEMVIIAVDDALIQ